MKSPFFRSKTKDANEFDETHWLLLDSDVPIVKEGVVKSFISWIRDPNCRPYRYAIAILIALTEGMLCYLIDMPGGIQNSLILVMRLDNSQYNMIFSAYTWADIVMSVVGTIIVNQFLNIRVGLFVFLTIILLGQLLYSIGSFVNSFLFSLLGRIIIGVGMGTTISILKSFQIIWFWGKEITFIMSLSRCVTRTMATLALFTPQLTYDALKPVIPSSLNRLGITNSIGILFCVIAFMCATCVVLLDKHGAKFIGRKPPPNKRVNIFQVLNFPGSFWIVGLICCIFYGVVISFTANGPLFYVSRYNFSPILANLANSLSYASIVFVTPFIALLIDLVGYNLIWCIIGIWMVITSNILLIAMGSDMVIPLMASLIVSLSYSFFGSAAWVMPGFIVDKQQVTTAYGVLMSLYALTISVFGVTGGVIVDHYGYFILIMFYIVLLFLIFLFTFALSVTELFADKKVLNITGRQRRSCNR